VVRIHNPRCKFKSEKVNGCGRKGILPLFIPPLPYREQTPQPLTGNNGVVVLTGVEEKEIATLVYRELIYLILTHTRHSARK